MKKILITGASGMLGATLVKLWNKKYQIFATASSDYPCNPAKNFKRLDLKAKNYQVLTRWVKPDVIIHCAALTSHEYCQSNPKEAMLVNGDSVKKLIYAFPNSKLLYISTDAVFPLDTHLTNEKTKTKPATVYGKSKELGEKYLLNSGLNGCIIRTTIVGKNINQKKTGFVERIVYTLKNNQEISLFDDVLMTPITIWDLAKELEWILLNKAPKILHVGGTEIISKYKFGYRLAKKMGLDTKLIKAAKLSTRKIKRSHDQSLDSSLYQKISGRKLPDLKQTINSLYKHFK